MGEAAGGLGGAGAAGCAPPTGIGRASGLSGADGGCGQAGGGGTEGLGGACVGSIVGEVDWGAVEVRGDPPTGETASICWEPSMRIGGAGRFGAAGTGPLARVGGGPGRACGMSRAPTTRGAGVGREDGSGGAGDVEGTSDRCGGGCSSCCDPSTGGDGWPLGLGGPADCGLGRYEVFTSKEAPTSKFVSKKASSRSSTSSAGRNSLS